MDSNGYFENMDYQLFILLAEVLKFCPDMGYLYGHYNDDIDKLSFYGSDSRHSICKLDKEFTVSVHRKDNMKPVKIKELSLFDYEKYLSTKEFSFDTYKTKDIYWEIESENIDYNTIFSIIKKTFIDSPVDEKLLGDLYFKKKYLENLNLSIQRLDTKEIFNLNEIKKLESFYNIRSLTLKELKHRISKLKYCLPADNFESIIYGKLPYKLFKDIFICNRRLEDPLENEECFNLIKDYYNCESIRKIYNWADMLFIEIK